MPSKNPTVNNEDKELIAVTLPVNPSLSVVEESDIEIRLAQAELELAKLRQQLEEKQSAQRYYQDGMSAYQYAHQEILLRLFRANQALQQMGQTTY